MSIFLRMNFPFLHSTKLSLQFLVKISFYQLEVAKTSLGHKILLVMLFQCNLRKKFLLNIEERKCPKQMKFLVFFYLWEFFVNNVCCFSFKTQCSQMDFEIVEVLYCYSAPCSMYPERFRRSNMS